MQGNGLVGDLRMLAELSNKIATYFRDQEISETMVRDDLRMLDEKKRNLVMEVQALESRIIEVKKEHETIITQAKSEAEKYVQMAKQNLFEAQKVKQNTEDENREVKSLRYRLDRQLKEAEKAFTTK